MSRHLQTFLRALLGLSLAVGALQPLRAQLDPRLQNSKTDFLDLYQQSSSLKAKPEIATIFDCSGSMNSLMFHPLYVNNDTQDADDYRYMAFALTQKTTGGTTPAGNVYRITAATANGCADSGTMLVTVNNNNTATFSAPSVPGVGCPNTLNYPTYTVTATAAGNASCTTTIQFRATTTVTVGLNTYYSGYQVVGGADTPNGTYKFENSGGATSPTPVISSSATSGIAYGTSVTLTVYLAHVYNSELDPSDYYKTGWGTNGGSVACPGGCTGSNYGNGCSNQGTNFYESQSTFTLPNALFAPNPTQLKPIVVNPNALGAGVVFPYTCPTGTVVTLNDFFITPGTSTKINWTTINNNGGTYIPPADIVNPSPAQTTPNPLTSYNAASQNVTWTVPNYNTTTNTTGGTPGYVTVTLDMSQSAYMAAQTPAIAAIALQTCATNNAAPYQALRKPDGTAVTAADANAVAGTLYGTSQGEMDVRNWIRAASHVRFLYKPTGTATTWRTIDIPIPWKNTTPNPVVSPGTRTLSTGVPLASTTVLDQEVEVTTVNGQTVTTTYGSGNQIELDQTYKIEGISYGVFSAHANATDFNGNPLTNAATTSVYLSGVVYRPAYLTWLFTGKYQNTTTLPYYNAAYTGKYIVFDAVANTAQVGGQGAVAWGAGYGPAAVPWGNMSVSQYNSAGTYTGSSNLEASAYAIPALTRLQAVKSAAINTWIGHQADVFWAFRELDPTNEAQAGNATQINDNSTTTITGATPIPPTTRLNGNDSGWTILNNYLSTDSTTTGAGTSTVTVTSNAGGHSLNGMARVSYLFANGETPLTYAMARTLAQYEDPSSVLNTVEGSNVSQCVNSFLLLFTDGVDNNGASGTNTNNPNNTTPYIHADPLNGNALTLFALDGNHQVIQNPTNINPTGLVAGVPSAGPWWNIFTLAGISAHLSDSSLGVAGTDYLTQGTPPSGAQSPSAFLPYAIGQRGDTTDNNLTNFSKPHRVTVMTVGVSLGGTTTSGPKQNLFWAAVAGDPATNSGALSTFHTFIPPAGTYGTGTWVANDWVLDPQDPSDFPTVGQRAPGAVYYFDATNPTLLSQDMKYAFMLAIGTPSNNATSNPEMPFVGASLGQETYLGSFQPPIAGGVVWPGDLEMFATRSVNGQVSILDKSANVATTLNSSSAQWSAASAVTARLWSARNLYTRLPSASAVESPIYPITPIQWNSAQWTSNNDPIFNAMNTSLTLNSLKSVLQFAAGGDISTVTAPNPPATNRNNIMGDIIDSAPAALEYNFSQVSGSLTSRLSAVGGNRFRLILVGTNQGWLHAFGEVTKSISDPNGDGNTITTGDVDELWAFMPTDFLAHLDYLTVPNNTHRYLVDGSPTVYFLDLPVSGSGPGNGVVDNNERAVAIFGLGKGGRSYYALDVHDPYHPALLWSLVPDEAANFPTGRIVSGGPSLTTVQTILANFGYSTSNPSMGRISFNGVLHDAVFIGGGFSEPEIEPNFGGNKLGRSVMALDVYTGQVLAAVDLTAGNIGGSTVGPVGTGLVPFEFNIGSNMAQRAYFLDYSGGLWAWGSKNVSTTAPFNDFRIDTSELTSWSVRKVFQDDNTAASGLGGRYTTPPAPFVVSGFQGPALSGQATPPAVGVAMVSGDRNNPLDRNYYTTPAPPNPSPTNHQLTVVFDRQDSRGFNLDTANGPDTGIQPGIGSTNLLTKLPSTPILTTPGSSCSDPVFQVFTPGCNNYYLGTASSPRFGYYLPFPSISSGFIPKGINPPIVATGSLFYSYFTPTSSNPCTGGAGNTTSWLIADVMNPIVNDQRPGMATPSGMRDDWTGVASNYIAIGTNSVLQGGTVPVANPLPGAATTTPQIHTTPTPGSTLAPKVRVWRKVQ